MICCILKLNLCSKTELGNLEPALFEIMMIHINTSSTKIKGITKKREASYINLIRQRINIGGGSKQHAMQSEALHLTLSHGGCCSLHLYCIHLENATNKCVSYQSCRKNRINM